MSNGESDIDRAVQALVKMWKDCGVVIAPETVRKMLLYKREIKPGLDIDIEAIKAMTKRLKKAWSEE